MYFKKLELLGFKSFMDKTTLHFEPGVTAIVGPNGCGKSNIFDSIRWVLGEQSVKSLRGSSMEDVIFNGTDSKPALGMAEVSLTFDNEAKYFNVDNDEVVVTRRIFRSGESEYLLNKVGVRLKDITDLLLGTGIGAESYSLVAQGKIDLILSSRPEDRRVVFDEAAGVTKYKSQKREALRKLEETEQNLLRVNDIVTEVKRQIGSLERQANKARRYKESYEDLKLKEINLGFLQKEKLTKAKYELTLELNSIKEQEEALQIEIKDREGQMSLRSREIKSWEEELDNIKSEIGSLENVTSHSSQHISFSENRIEELKTTRQYLQDQILQAENRFNQDRDKLNKLKEEQAQIKQHAAEKSQLFKEKEVQFNAIVESIRVALENIAVAKKNILEAAAKNIQIKNEVTDLNSKDQIYQARKKRLEIERAKVNEENSVIDENLKKISLELGQLETEAGELVLKVSGFKSELEQKNASLVVINNEISGLEKELLTLQSYKEFLEKLKTQYEDITTSMGATIYLDRPLPQGVSGLIVKVKEYLNIDSQEGAVKISAEAKPIDLDTQRVNSRIAEIEEKIKALNDTRQNQESLIGELNSSLEELLQKQNGFALALANKNTVFEAAKEQHRKIGEENNIICLELDDVNSQIGDLQNSLSQAQARLAASDSEHSELESFMHKEQEKVSLNSVLKEEVIVNITQIKTELADLEKRVNSEGTAFKSLDENLRQDEEAVLNLQKQLKENQDKEGLLVLEIKELRDRISLAQSQVQNKQEYFKDAQDKHEQSCLGLSAMSEEIEEKRKGLNVFKDTTYDLQMRSKDIDFKYSSIKERIAQGYKIDLDSPDLTQMKFEQPVEENALSQQIQQLKDKLDSYGTVNLVAIEEYDELKKRYDFLVQQQGDLAQAKESLQEAIRKINQTTKKMFLETFEKVREEFKKYFKLLFNGGDAQLFLIDEADPLESGIEIICRPPGKKLQNVLLLSGGEKTMSAIALIFAIFKVKPAPFCVLDEIDAALDEANVDRFGRLLQEFIKDSQFIVITHNKRTIANANVMYGITMEESGLSKIVSVKFAENKKFEEERQREPVPA
jgi:chromosome segregation protein